MLKISQLAFVLFVVFALLSIKCWAEEITSVNEPSTQDAKIEKSVAVFDVQKQPLTETTKQKMNVQKSFFCIVIQVNGKVKEDLK